VGTASLYPPDFFVRLLKIRQQNLSKLKITPFFVTGLNYWRAFRIKPIAEQKMLYSNHFNQKIGLVYEKGNCIDGYDRHDHFAERISTGCSTARETKDD
jgi:hypothetical protein